MPNERTNKTKTEMEAEIKDLKRQLDAKTKEEKYDDCAKEIHNMYTSYSKVGFTEEQAWELIKIIMNNSTAPKHSIF